MRPAQAAAAVTGFLGVCFWLVSARTSTVAEMGLAGAALAAVQLSAASCTLALHGLLASRPPREPRRMSVRAGLIAVGATSSTVALVAHLSLVAVGGPPSLEQLKDPRAGLLVALAAAVVAIAIAVDRAGLARRTPQRPLGRAVVAGLASLVLVGGAALTGQGGPEVLVVAWWGGTLVSLGWVAVRGRTTSGASGEPRLVERGTVRGLRRNVADHAADVTLRVPLVVLPLLALSVLTPTATGIFVAALSIAVALGGLSSVLSSVPATTTDLAEVIHHMRSSLPLALGVSVVATATVVAAAPVLLSEFAPEYASRGTLVLQLLAAAAVPHVIRVHTVALRRAQGRTNEMTTVLAAFLVLEFGAAVVGAVTGGLEGLCAAWVAVLIVEASVLLVPLVAVVHQGGLLGASRPLAGNSRAVRRLAAGTSCAVGLVVAGRLVDRAGLPEADASWPVVLALGAAVLVLRGAVSGRFPSLSSPRRPVHLLSSTAWLVAITALTAAAVTSTLQVGDSPPSSSSVVAAPDPPAISASDPTEAVELSLARVDDLRAEVVISAAEDAGPFEVRTDPGGASTLSYPVAAVRGGEAVTTEVLLPSDGRLVVTLNTPGRPEPLKTLAIS